MKRPLLTTHCKLMTACNLLSTLRPFRFCRQISRHHHLLSTHFWRALRTQETHQCSPVCAGRQDIVCLRGTRYAPTPTLMRGCVLLIRSPGGPGTVLYNHYSQLIIYGWYYQHFNHTMRYLLFTENSFNTFLSSTLCRKTRASIWEQCSNWLQTFERYRTGHLNKMAGSF